MQRTYCWLAGLLTCLVVLGGSFAANAADNRTVLYYLMEVQRQRGKPCPGGQQATLPNLMPSSSLAAMAQELSRTGDAVQRLRPSFGLSEEDALFETTFSAPTPQAALQYMKDNACQGLMDPAHAFVGATQQGTTWTVLLAGKNPVAPPELQNNAAPSVASAQAAVGAENADAPFYGTPEAAAPALVAPPPPVAPQVPRSGVTPLAEDPAPKQMPIEALQNESVAAQKAEHGSARGAAPLSPVGGSATGAIMLTDKDGRQVPVVIEGDTPEVLPEGGMVINKNKSEGFTGEAASSFMQDGALQEHSTSTATVTAEARELLDLINAKRSAGQFCAGVLRKGSPLRLNATLATIAQNHADDMATKGYFASTSPEGVGVGDRLTLAGYEWTKAGEMLAVASPPVKNVLLQWLDSPNQCDALMDPAMKEAGVGFAREQKIWVVTLTAP